jgi:crossover junction endodeoxyribonuclease RuvC
MRVLGVDPGTVATGWGVVDEANHRLRYVSGGVIRARGPLAQRLACIFEHAQRILSEFAPHSVSLEKTFVGENVQSAFRLGEARGAILVASARAGIPVCEYSPAEIKVAVAGHGRAVKEQMQIMVARLLALSKRPAGDEADALGAAICHLHTQSFAARVGEATYEGRPSIRRRSLDTRSKRATATRDDRNWSVQVER